MEQYWINNNDNISILYAILMVINSHEKRQVSHGVAQEEGVAVAQRGIWPLPPFPRYATDKASDIWYMKIKRWQMLPKFYWKEHDESSETDN